MLDSTCFDAQSSPIGQLSIDLGYTGQEEESVIWNCGFTKFGSRKIISFFKRFECPQCGRWKSTGVSLSHRGKLHFNRLKVSQGREEKLKSLIILLLSRVFVSLGISLNFTANRKDPQGHINNKHRQRLMPGLRVWRLLRAQ